MENAIKRLPADFSLNRYGLHVRLVNESDAEFILKLRTDEELSKFLHPTENDLSKQVKWIVNYKKREEKGEEYYFIFYKKNIPTGLNRIYGIKKNVFTTGSWVFEKNMPFECAIASALITREIAFNIIGCDFENGYDGCHIDNKKVLKFNRMLGMKESGRIKDKKGIYITMTLTKDDFNRHEKLLLRFINY